MNGIKYCLVSSYFFEEIMAARGQDPTTMTGLYSWVRAFKGHSLFVPRVDKETAEKFDIIHVNMTPRNMMILQDLRELLGHDTSVKIACNIDFSVDLWQENFKSPPIPMLFRELRKADLLFHVEPYGASVAEHMINLNNNGHPYKKVHVLPHPTDTKHVQEKIKDSREPWCGVMWHRYDNSWLPPYLALQGIPDLQKILLGFMDFNQTGVAPTYEYDKVFRRLEFNEALEQMSRCMIGCDPTTIYSYGRAIVDFATLGVPVVGSVRIDAMNRIFPDLALEPFDVKGMFDLFNKLYYDKEFYENQKELGLQRSEHYSLKNCRKRMIDAMELEDTGYPPHMNEDFKKIWKDLTDKQWQQEYNDAMGFCILCGDYPPVTFKAGHLHVPTLTGRSQWTVKQIPIDKNAFENPKHSVLDMGCFQGVTLFNLLLKGLWNLTGIDVADVAIEQANKNLCVLQQVYDQVDTDLSDKVKFKTMFAENSVDEFGENAFDIIVAEEILEHVRDPVKVLEQIHSLLKPSGKAIMTVPMNDLVKSPYHIHKYSEEKLHEVFKDYIVTIVSIKPFWGIELFKDKRGKEIWKAKEQMMFDLGTKMKRGE